MKRLLLSLLAFPLLVHAEAVTLNFKAIPVIDFAQATFKTMLGKDYVIAPDLIGLDKRVTISVKSIDRAKLPRLLDDVLSSVGVRAREANGIVHLEKAAEDAAQDLNQPSRNSTPATAESKPAEPEDFEVYRPKNRTVEYLQAVLRTAGLASSQGQGQQTAQDALIVVGNAERRAKVMRLLFELDRKPVVMNVRAALVEFTDSKDDSFNFGAFLNLLNGRLSFGLNGGVTPSDTFARIKSGSIDAVLKVVNGDTRFRFRTQPTLRLLDGEPGRLMVGNEVPVRGALTLSKDGTPIQSIEYRSSPDIS